MEITSFGYSCVKHREDPESCYFYIGKIAGKSLSVDDLTDLLQKGETEGLKKGLPQKIKRSFGGIAFENKERMAEKQSKFDFQRMRQMNN